MRPIPKTACPATRVIWVEQAHYGIRLAYTGQGKRYMGTVGMQPCVGLALYNAQTKSGALAHFDSDAVRVASMAASWVAQVMHRRLAGTVTATIIMGAGPDASSHRIASSIAGHYFGSPPEIRPMAGGADSIVLDLEDGALTAFDFPKNYPVSASADWQKAMASSRDYFYSRAVF
ncbi:MAG: hypothetical protein ACI9U2_002487 [Bradymonadia bacterium]|jgi:hypothetical protein